LPQSANPGQAALEAVARDINELEALCLEIDASIDERNWDRLGTAMSDSRRVTHALQNAMGEATPYRTSEFDKAVFERLAHIYAYRQERMDRLQAAHDEIGERLRQLSRWKTYARSIAGNQPRSRSSLLDSRR
jgi:hypothetical protein